MADYLLVDGKNLLWRAASVMKLSSGESKTGGTFGFLKGLIRTHEMFGGKTIVCWDDWDSGPKARKDIYPEYKRRKHDPERERLVEDIVQQMDDLRKFLKYMGIRQIRSKTWEADDVMATLARKLPGRIVIYTGDRDLFQCINKRTTVARPMNNGDIEEYGDTEFRKEFGVRVKEYVDYKALVGDASDNIPGCKGIGPKSAVVIIGAYGNVESALAAAFHPEFQKANPEFKASWKNLLVLGDKPTRLSKSLAKVNSHAPLCVSLCAVDHKKARKMLIKYRMSTLLTQFDKLKALQWED